MIGFVYLWENIITGQKYIGLHKGTETDGYVGSGMHFQRAIKKYGIDAFRRTILHRETNSEQQLYQREFDLINAHNAVDNKNYYNLTNYDPKGVTFVDGKKHRTPMNHTTKQKIRAARLGKVASITTKKKMSESRLGRPSPRRGVVGIFTVGQNNGNFGKKWHNNGETSVLAKVNSLGPEWVIGRIMPSMTGSKNPFYGKHHSEETKTKFRQTLARKLT